MQVWYPGWQVFPVCGETVEERRKGDRLEFNKLFQSDSIVELFPVYRNDQYRVVLCEKFMRGMILSKVTKSARDADPSSYVWVKFDSIEDVLDGDGKSVIPRFLAFWLPSPEL